MDRIDSYNFSIYQGRRQFTDGPPGTVINAEWLTAVQEEICSVIESQGITLEKSENDQLVQALRAFAVPDWASPWFDVTEYGAKPLASISESDGTDSAIGITRAVNDACYTTGSIRYVIFPPGLYDCRSPAYIGDAFSAYSGGSHTGQPWKSALIEGYGSRLRFRGTIDAVVMYGGLNDPYTNGSNAATWTNHLPLERSGWGSWGALTGAETGTQSYWYPSTEWLTTQHELVFSVRNMLIDVASVHINVSTPIAIYGGSIADQLVDETYMDYNHGLTRTKYSTFYNVCGVIPDPVPGSTREHIISRRSPYPPNARYLTWYQHMFRRNMTYSQVQAYSSLASAIGKDKA